MANPIPRTTLNRDDMAGYSGHTRIHQWSQRHWVLTFGVMLISFSCFGVLSLKLAEQTLANLALIREHGWLALEEGALWQLLSLLSQACVAVFFYFVFKVCESALVQRLFNRH